MNSKNNSYSDEESSGGTTKGIAWRGVRELNLQACVLACAVGLIVDPLFLYTLSVNSSMMCLSIDGWFAMTLTAMRCMVDAVHVWNTCLKIMKEAGEDVQDDRVVNIRKKEIVVHEAAGSRRSRCRGGYLTSVRGYLLDLIVLLPVMQVVVWVVAPMLIKKGAAMEVTTTLLISFLFHYLPKIYHSICFLRRIHNFSGYIFGTIWWGIALNLVAYFVASHAAGACWYLLGVQRMVKCLNEQCSASMQGCKTNYIACKSPIYFYGEKIKMATRAAREDGGRLDWATNLSARSTCLESSDNFPYGAYKWSVQLITNTSRLEKILLPVFWGLMTLSTFGNLESTTEWVEIVFNIIIVTGGLLLVTMLIGNIKVFLQATASKKQALHLRMRSVEWWMRRKHLPKSYRQRVRHYERQQWAAMRGVNEPEMIRNLPEGLRRDIKYHLCLDLVRQVPLFQHMDNIVLENICDRVKSLIFPKGETITREGDPVQRMLFIVRGHLQSSQVLRDGVVSCCMLGPGNFSGDELLSWCLRRPFVERLPLSSSTLVTLETTEAFGLEASDVKYVTQHFRYTFVKEKVRRSTRYYSPGWRTWAAVAIQMVWRRYKHRKTLTSLSFIRPRRPISRCSSLGEEKLRLYTALLTSPKPHQDDFF